MAGPLLAPGLVIAEDLPVVPHPHLASDYWGVTSGTHAGALNRLPIDLLLVALGHLGLVALGEKLLLLAIVVLAGYGMHRLVPAERTLGRWFAGLLYAVNPFVYARLATGQWYLLLGYALLPWSLAELIPLTRGEWRRAWRFAAIATAVGVADPHMAALLAVLVVALAAATIPGSRNRTRALAAVGLGCALTVLTSLYWLAPTPGLRDLWAHVGFAQLRLYQTVGDPAWGLGGAVAGLSGYWNDPDRIASHLSAWPLLTASMLLLAAWGIGVRRADPVTWAITAAGAFGFLLALGTHGPTGPLFHALLDHVAAARSFREPQKGVALLAFAYAYLGGIAAADIHADSRRTTPAAVAAALAAALLTLPLLAGYRELGGLSGTLGTSTYPTSWTQARSLLQRRAAGSRTLVLPWHGYYALSFAGHRVVANTLSDFLATPVLASRSVGEGAAANDSSDPLDRVVTRLLSSGGRRHDLGACLATLGVSHVLVAEQADWRRYGFLAHQRDLVVEHRWADLVLYRNLHPAALVMQITHLGRGLCDTRGIPAATSAPDPAHLRLRGDLAPGALLAVPAAAGADWTLGGSHGSRLAEAVDLFRLGSGATRGLTLTSTTWSPLRRNYLVGLIGLLLAAGISLLLGRRPAAPRDTARRTVSEPRRVWIVLPTYNEADNLRPMVEALQATLAAARIDGTILVVDDDSPDGTGALADALATAASVRVLHRAAKNGLGRAYLDGFRLALDEGAELVVQMDCDFSHDPRDVPRLVAACAAADIVLGSRYVRGGRVENWPLTRRLLSKLGNAYARVLLGTSVHDLTGGFKCFRREALEALDLDAIYADGYGFQIETTYRAGALGLEIAEVPITFRDRRAGSSKMSRRIAIEALLLVPRLRVAQAAAAPRSPERRSSATVAASSRPHASESTLAD